MSKKIAMMGGKDSILPFKGIGIDVFPVTDIGDAKETIKSLASDYGVIFLTERVAEQLPETVALYDDQIAPAIILIPSSTGSLGIGMKRIQENVEKAVGQDIL